MQTEAQRQAQINIKLKELAELEKQVSDTDLYEQNIPQQQESNQPQQKYYDIEQLLVAMWSETLTSTVLEVPMSEFKKSRLLMIRDKLLYEMDLTELVPSEPVREPEPEPEMESIPVNHNEEMDRSIDSLVNPKFSVANRDLDTISQKMKDIDSIDGLMQPEQEPEEPSGLQRLLGGLGGKRKIVERAVDEKHQPSSMG